jgi:hypothetical protein
LAVLAFVVLALIRGDLVPGFIYRASVAREEKASEQAAKNAEALTVLVKAAASGANGIKHA